MKTFAVTLLLMFVPTLAMAGALPAPVEPVAAPSSAPEATSEVTPVSQGCSTIEALGSVSWLADLFHQPYEPTVRAVVAHYWVDPSDPAGSCDRIDCLDSCATEQINCTNACAPGDGVCGQECLQAFRSCREDCRNCVSFDGFP